uniref:Uncharacterized protein n=1 Tax=Physcomitrium patens TaxID=3218 RepID=A0A2K1IWZ3_PHYPA|nr:hypothetical protein PHYPA_023615 [Physcomitrium patens]
MESQACDDSLIQVSIPKLSVFLISSAHYNWNVEFCKYEPSKIYNEGFDDSRIAFTTLCVLILHEKKFLLFNLENSKLQRLTRFFLVVGLDYRQKNSSPESEVLTMTSGDVAGRYCGDRSADGPARVIMSCGTDCDYGRYRDVGEGKNLTMRLHQSRVQESPENNGEKPKLFEMRAIDRTDNFLLSW